MESNSKNAMESSKTTTFKPNVSTLERIGMITFGAYLIYKATAKKNEVCIGKMTTGAAMLLRGFSGYCPLYDAVHRLKNDKAS